MTEEIIENQEPAAEAQENIKEKARKMKLPANPFSKRKKAGKNQGDFSRLDLILISLTGFLAFCGLIFCVVMIPLLRSIGY